MNKKSQARYGVNIFSIIFVAIIFIAMMALGFGTMINEMIGIGVAAGHVTGLEAFLLDNFVLWIMLIFILWLMIAGSQS